MKEVDVQKKVIEAVESIGGVGHKMSNRFLIGVCDLSLKLTNYPLLFAECKLKERPASSNVFDLGVSKLQREFLLTYDKVGQPTCIMSFLHITVNYQVKQYWMAMFPPSVDRASKEVYIEIPRGYFNRTVAYQIERYLMEIEK